MGMSSCSTITQSYVGTHFKNWDSMVPGVETTQNELLRRQRADPDWLEAVRQELESDQSSSERTRCVFDVCVALIKKHSAPGSTQENTLSIGSLKQYIYFFQ